MTLFAHLTTTNFTRVGRSRSRDSRPCGVERRGANHVCFNQHRKVADLARRSLLTQRGLGPWFASYLTEGKGVQITDIAGAFTHTGLASYSRVRSCPGCGPHLLGWNLAQKGHRKRSSPDLKSGSVCQPDRERAASSEVMDGTFGIFIDGMPRRRINRPICLILFSRRAVHSESGLSDYTHQRDLAQRSVAM